MGVVHVCACVYACVHVCARVGVYVYIYIMIDKLCMNISSDCWLS